MSLLYYLADTDSASEDEKIFRAFTESDGKVDIDKLVSRIIQKRDLYSRHEISAIINYFFEELEESIANGEEVTLPVFHSDFSIDGVFAGAKDKFDPLRHKLNVNFQPSYQLKAKVNNIKFRKDREQRKHPLIRTVLNVRTNTYTNLLSSYDPLVLRGTNLKVGGRSVNSGVFFSNIYTKEEVKVPKLACNDYSKIVFTTPELEPGDWELTIRTQLDKYGQITKGMKLGTFDKIFSVVKGF